MEMYTIDIAIYQPVALRSSPIIDPNHQHMKPAQAKDVEIALAELLPVVSDLKSSLIYDDKSTSNNCSCALKDCTRGVLYSSTFRIKCKASEWKGKEAKL